MNTTAVGIAAAAFVVLLGLMGMTPPGADQEPGDNCVGAHCGGPVLPGTPGTQGAPWGEGGLTPKTIRVRRAVLTEFGPMQVIGKAPRGDVSEHPIGRALDFMTGRDKAKGQAIARWVVAHADELDVQYVIFNQHIHKARSPERGWTLMEDRGTPTANHEDHPHVSVLP